MKWIAIITYFGVFIGALGSLVSAYKQENEKLKANGETLDHGKFFRQHPVTITILSALLVGTMSLVSTFRQENDKVNEKLQTEKQNTEKAISEKLFQEKLSIQNREMLELQKQLRERSDKVAELYKQIAQSQAELRKNTDEQLFLQKILSKKSSEIADLSHQLALKSDHIASLNQDIAASATGGNSYCFIIPLIHGNSFRPTVLHNGQFPLYDVRVRIIDVDIYSEMEKQNPNISVAQLLSTDVTIPVGNLPPRQSYVDFKMPLINFSTDKPRFNIFITAKNGIFEQVLRMRKINGEWKVAFQVVKNNYSEKTPNAKNTILKEEIQEGFPLGKDGKIDWDK